jgi:hypothetical protein
MPKEQLNESNYELEESHQHIHNHPVHPQSNYIDGAKPKK